jgi:predicted MPP superfamily phosphohydrolase
MRAAETVLDMGEKSGDFRIILSAVRELLPAKFDGFTLLHLSDMHADLNRSAMARLAELLPDLSYDVCVITGDFRGPTFGPFNVALEGLARVRALIKAPVFAVLGNHDTIRMVPEIDTVSISA